MAGTRTVHRTLRRRGGVHARARSPGPVVSSAPRRLIALLRRHAPTWLAQMPSLLEATELEALQRAVAGATQTRMLREMAEAVEAITTEMPLVLILEDLQWSDYSTVALLAALARRREAARLLVIATYRPMEVLLHEHPLDRVKQEVPGTGIGIFVRRRCG